MANQPISNEQLQLLMTQLQQPSETSSTETFLKLGGVVLIIALVGVTLYFVFRPKDDDKSGQTKESSTQPSLNSSFTPSNTSSITSSSITPSFTPSLTWSSTTPASTRSTPQSFGPTLAPQSWDDYSFNVFIDSDIYNVTFKPHGQFSMFKVLPAAGPIMTGSYTLGNRTTYTVDLVLRTTEGQTTTLKMNTGNLQLMYGYRPESGAFGLAYLPRFIPFELRHPADRAADDVSGKWVKYNYSGTLKSPSDDVTDRDTWGEMAWTTSTGSYSSELFLTEDVANSTTNVKKYNMIRPPNMNVGVIKYYKDKQVINMISPSDKWGFDVWMIRGG